MESEKQAKKKVKFRLCIEVSVLGVIVLVLWGLISLPIVFYNMPTTFTRNTSLSLSIPNNSGYSLPLQYNGGICFAPLKNILSSQNCQVNDTGVVLVSSNNEAIARTVIRYVNQLNPSPECSQNMVSFVCLYFFGLCGEEEDLIQPTMDECEDIQFKTCSREWELAIASGFDLPDCKMLPMEQNISCPSSKESKESLILICQEDFFLDEDLQICVASCQSWSQHDKVTTTALHIAILMSNCIGFLLAIIVLVVSVIRHKSMFEFPSIFLVYSTIDLLVFDFFIIIGNSDTNLFCSSPSILNNTVTPFCVINGMVFTFTLIQLGLWWMFHLGILFWSVWFPFHYQKYKTGKKLKYVHGILFLIGNFLPILSIIATMSHFARSIKGSQDTSFISGGLGFSQFNNPPMLCTAHSLDIVFYTKILPIDSILAVVGLLALLIAYGFYKNNKIVGTLEKKLMLVICYYMIFTAIIIVAFTMIFKNGEAILNAIDDYFLCEGQGLNPSSPCRRNFEQYDSPVVLILALTVLALYPLYILIFVVNIRELKQICKRKFALTKSLKSSSAIAN